MNFKKYLKTESPMIFEIGSNNGDDTIKFFKEFESPTVHCFEPLPSAYRELCARMKQHDIKDYLEQKIFLNDLAVSDKEGVVEFFVANNLMSSSIKQPTFHMAVYPEVKFLEKIKVNTISLDHYVELYDIKYCDLVYMDVQGAEDLVFNGGERFFRDCVKYIYTEFSNIEIYDGALTKNLIMAKLPYFELVEVVWEWLADGDMLLVNSKFK